MLILSNNISYSGMVPLSDALKVSSALFRETSSFAVLLLPGNMNFLGFLFVQANKTIRTLVLWGNQIGDAGMLPLGDALKVDFVLFREISSFALLLRR